MTPPINSCLIVPISWVHAVGTAAYYAPVTSTLAACNLLMQIKTVISILCSIWHWQIHNDISIHLLIRKLAGNPKKSLSDMKRVLGNYFTPCCDLLIFVTATSVLVSISFWANNSLGTAPLNQQHRD